MTSLSHPFKDNPELIEIPSEYAKDVEEFYEWILAQPQFPNYSRNHAVLFLHACYWDKKAAKEAIEKYGDVRGGAPEIFDERDPMLPNIQHVFNITQMIRVPKKTPEGYELLMYRLIDTDPSKIMFADCLKGFCMFNDIRLTEDLLADGYVVVMDMKGVRLSHITRVQFGPMRSIMAYIQEAHPARLKKIYICHAASFVNQIMAMVKPLIKSEMLQLLHFTTKGPESLFEKDILPKEYKGTLDSFDKYYEEQRGRLETVYRDWLIDSSKLKDKPKEKSKTSSTSNGKTKIKASKKAVKPPIRSFTALEID